MTPQTRMTRYPHPDFKETRMYRTLTSLALTLALTPMAGASADADVPWKWNDPDAACVTGWEQNQLRYGQTRTSIEELLDGPGRVGKKGQAVYRPCNRPWTRGQVWVFYKRDRLDISFKVVVSHARLEVPAKG